MQGRRYVIGWLAVGTVATVIALATVVFVRGAVGGDQVVGALSPADVSAQLSAAVQGGATRPSTPAASSDPAAAGPGSTPTGSSTGPRSTPGPSTKPSSHATGHTPTPTHVSGGSGTPSPSPSQTSVTRLLTSAGGSVVAQCTSTGRSATVYLVSWSPAQGFTVHPPQNRGPAAEVEIEFESDQTSVSVNIHCSSTGPVQTVTTDSGWGGGGDD